MKEIDFSYFIEKFIAGEMDENEEQWFRKEMTGNRKLRQEVEMRQKTEAFLKKQDVMNLREKLSSITKERQINNSTSRRTLPYFIRYAAAIAVLLVIGGIAFLPGRWSGAEEIADRFYRPYDPATSIRSETDTSGYNYNLALEYYKVHDYKNAIIHFSKALYERPYDMHSELLNGISNFEINNYQAAKESFFIVINDNQSLFIDHAQWYLALCYIKTHEITLAAVQLALIEKSNSIYRKFARKILKRIK